MLDDEDKLRLEDLEADILRLGGQKAISEMR